MLTIHVSNVFPPWSQTLYSQGLHHVHRKNHVLHEAYAGCTGAEGIYQNRCLNRSTHSGRRYLPNRRPNTSTFTQTLSLDLSSAQICLLSFRPVLSCAHNNKSHFTLVIPLLQFKLHMLTTLNLYLKTQNEATDTALNTSNIINTSNAQ